MPIHPENEFDFPGLNIKRGTSLSGDLSGKLPGPITVSSIAGASSIIVTGSLTAGSLHGPVVGTTTNDDAAAGNVGETITSTVVSGSAVALTSPTISNITSISLTAGDWDVRGNVLFNTGAGTTVSGIFGAIHTTSATDPMTAGPSMLLFLTFTASQFQRLALPPFRYSLAGTTTIYLMAASSFAVSTMGGYGWIQARRIR